MSIVASQVGIDVSLDWLDVSIDSGKAFRKPNTADGVRSLIQRLPAGSVIHLESSGGYERIPRSLLRKAGFEVRTHDPLKVKRQAQVEGRRGKTDALDARHLSNSGNLLKAQPEKSEARESLCDLSRTIQELKKAATQMTGRAARPGLATHAKNALKAAAAGLSLQAAKLEKEFVKMVKASPLADRYRLALSVQGVGPCLARVATSELPDRVHESTNAQLSSYAGIAPIDDNSGKKKAKARIRPGNAKLKAALYMPAMACVSRYEWAKDLYGRLRAKGRTHQQAIVAVMRRLLIRILDVVKRETPWVAKPNPS